MPDERTEKTEEREKTSSKRQAAAPEAPQAQQVPDNTADRRYTQDRLIQQSEGYFDQPHFVVAGALAEDDREELTLDQAKQAIASWLDGEEG